MFEVFYHLELWLVGGFVVVMGVAVPVLARGNALTDRLNADERPRDGPDDSGA